MTSFALQNYWLYQPFLIKTPRYNTCIQFLNTTQMLITTRLVLYESLLRFNLIQLRAVVYSLYWTQFSILNKYFFRMLYTRINQSYVTNNLESSFRFYALFKSTSSIHTVCSGLKIVSPFSLLTVIKPIRVLGFSFHYKSLNTFIFFIISFLTNAPFTTIQQFSLKYNIVLFKELWLQLSVWNNYYLRLHHF